MSSTAGLPTCVTVPPELLVLALRGALGGSAAGEVMVARTIRDHRDLLPEHVREQLATMLRRWLEHEAARASAVARAPWVVALKALGRPTQQQAAAVRRTEWERIARAEAVRPVGARS